jgi:hypothetical protein
MFAPELVACANQVALNAGFANFRDSHQWVRWIHAAGLFLIDRAIQNGGAPCATTSI